MIAASRSALTCSSSRFDAHPPPLPASTAAAAATPTHFANLPIEVSRDDTRARVDAPVFARRTRAPPDARSGFKAVPAPGTFHVSFRHAAAPAEAPATEVRGFF